MFRFRVLVTMTVGLAMALAEAAPAQIPPPDAARYGEEWGRDNVHPRTGRRPRVLVDPKIRQKNEGGTDGAGLCVIASGVTAGRQAGVPGIEKLWLAAKQDTGGYWPERLEALIAKVLPGEKYGSYTGTDTEVVERLVNAGHVVCTTTNTGALYNGQRIHHMVNTGHLDDEKAMIIDNNAPDHEIWTSRKTYDERFVDGSYGWAFNWARKPAVQSTGSILLIVAGGVLLAWFASQVLDAPEAEDVERDEPILEAA